MKNFKFLLILLIGMLASPLFARLAMKLTPNQMNYMQYEPIYMHLRIRNDSGRPIVFGKSAKLTAKLYFEISDVNGKIIEDFAPKAIKLDHGKVINPGQVGDIVLKFSHFYQLTALGAYRIHAYISYPLFKDMYKSNDVRIDITSGVQVWTRTLGVPDGVIGDDGKVITTDSSRTYSIRKLNESNQQFYYCTLEDKTRMYQVFRLGPVVGMDKPECMTDMSGALHILACIAPKIYKYYKVDISGRLLDDGKYYKTVKNTPHLIKGRDGKIFVNGGAVAIPNVDFAVREKSFTRMGEL